MEREQQMADPAKSQDWPARLWWFPPAGWLTEYRVTWLPSDIVAGVTLAAYAIPVSLAYAGLAGLPPQVGVYGYLLGGLGYALLGSSRQLAIGPTSAISLMIAGTRTRDPFKIKAQRDRHQTRSSSAAVNRDKNGLDPNVS